LNTQFITILGSTGSIGVNTLDVIKKNSDHYKVFALTANTQWQRLQHQILEFKPHFAVCFDEKSCHLLRQSLINESVSTKILSGLDGLKKVASDDRADTVVAAIVGAAGLLPTLAAVQTGKKILLANKETLVMAGEYFMEQVRLHQALLLPVDSEHNALFQSLPNHHYSKNVEINWSDFGVTKLVLTASGGPFLEEKLENFASKTPQQACLHPNWKMGRKISVDSATLMNKGLEVIEASYLYNMGPDQIDVVIHPQSIIHSMVNYKDGSVLAELGNPDMRTPIAHVLSWPQRIHSGVDMLDLIKNNHLDFRDVDHLKFPCLKIAYSALRQGGTAPAIINAANEVAVDAFLKEKIAFNEIPNIIHETLNQSDIVNANTLDIILRADNDARQLASKIADTKQSLSREN